VSSEFANIAKSFAARDEFMLFAATPVISNVRVKLAVTASIAGK